MNKKERRAANKEAAQQLFALIDSYLDENITLAETILAHNRSLRDRARHRYYPLLRQIDNLGASWGTLRLVIDELRKPDFALFFYKFYQNLNQLENLSPHIWTALSYTFDEIYSLQTLYLYAQMPFWPSPPLKKLSLSREKNIPPPPLSPHQLANLEILDFNQCPNAAKEILPLLQQSHNLQELIARDCELSSLPDIFDQMPQLSFANLSENNLRSLPPSLLNRPNLQRLFLDGCPLQTWPELANCPQLHTLTAESCQLDSIPAWLPLLPNLAYLNISRNPISILPSYLFAPPKLQNIQANYCKISQISPAKYTSTLRILSLSHNPLNQFPDILLSFSRLERLTLIKCNIQTLPDNIQILQNLLSLDCSENPISLLPPSLATLPRLDSIYANRCPFTQIPNFQNASLRRFIAYEGTLSKIYIQSRLHPDCSILGPK